MLALAAITMTGIGLSLGVVVGLVTVSGVSARNAILQLAHDEHLLELEGNPWNLATVDRGTLDARGGLSPYCPRMHTVTQSAALRGWWPCS